MATAQAPALVPAQPSVFRKRTDYTFTRHESWRDHDRVGGLGYMCAEDIDDAHKANRLDKDGNPMPLYRPRREHRIRHIEHTGVTGSTAMAHNVPDDMPKRDDGQRVKLSPTERLYLQAAVAKRYMRAIRLVATLADAFEYLRTHTLAEVVQKHYPNLADNILALYSELALGRKSRRMGELRRRHKPFKFTDRPWLA
jgi:hypothetical protein